MESQNLYGLDLYLQEVEKDRARRRERIAKTVEVSGKILNGTGRAIAWTANTAGRAIVNGAKGAYTITKDVYHGVEGAIDKGLEIRKAMNTEKDFYRLYGISDGAFNEMINSVRPEERPYVLEHLRERAPELRHLYQEEQERKRQERERIQQERQARRRQSIERVRDFSRNVGRNAYSRARNAYNRIRNIRRTATTPTTPTTTTTTTPTVPTAITPSPTATITTPTTEIDLEPTTEDLETLADYEADVNSIVTGRYDRILANTSYGNILSYVQKHSVPNGKLEQFVRDMAYEVYELRNRKQGLDTENWKYAQELISLNTAEAIHGLAEGKSYDELNESVDRQFVLPI